MGALVSGAYRYLMEMDHRRYGKDKMALNATIECMQRRVGQYVHVFPTLAEGRENLWENIDNDGFRTREHFPKELLAAEPNDSHMRIRFKNGSTWRVGGANRPDSIRGGNPVGIVWSEPPHMKPSVQLIADPITRRNKGWQAFLFTPIGRQNWTSRLFLRNQSNPAWWTRTMTVDDSGLMNAADIEEMRRAGYPEEWIQQEYYCSMAAALIGSYYGRLLEEGERAGRVGEFPWLPDVPVDLTFDIGLGLDDATAIWFAQSLPGGFRWIDYYESNVEGVHELTEMLQGKPYTYRTVVFPHDVRKREWAQAQQAGAGTRLDAFLRLMPQFRPRVRQVGQPGHVIVPAMNPAERINAGRRVLRRSQFHLPPAPAGQDELEFYGEVPNTYFGLEALRNYRREIDANKSKDPSVPFLKEQPVHDWASHGADAFGHFAVATPDAQRMPPEERLPPDADYVTRMNARREGRRGNTLSRNYRRR